MCLYDTDVKVDDFVLTWLTSVILEYIKLNNQYGCILYIYFIYVNTYVYLKTKQKTRLPTLKKFRHINGKERCCFWALVYIEAILGRNWYIGASLLVLKVTYDLTSIHM